VRRLFPAAILFLALIACSSGPPEVDVVSNATHLALIPAMETAADEIATLSAATETFCEAPDAANHEAAKEAWRTAKEAWERSELTTFFGPADMLRTVSKVDYAPISETGIEELLASDTIIDIDYIDNRAASTQRGLGAAEYALFRDTELAADERTCAFAASSSVVAANAATALVDSWTTSFSGGEPWVDVYTVVIPPNQSFGDLVASFVETLKRQSLFELGQALGVSAPEPDIEAIPEGAAGEAAAMYRSQLESIRVTLDAGGEDSLGELIRARSPEVADRIDETLDRAIAGVSGLGGPMRGIAAENPEDLEPIYQDIADLRTLFESDVVSLLDITLGFSDTDGDTG
jgi:predicted lipoprotein